MKSYNIILASQSPRRKELLQKIKSITFSVCPSNADETIDTSLSVEDTVMKLAQIKAKSVFDASNKESIVLGADTLVAIDNKILGKPKDFADAEQMFKELCGKTHIVLTGICFISKEKIIKKCEKTYVTFGAFDAEVVYNYIKAGFPFDKAGGYGIQDKELAPLIKKVEGSLSNVIGLPLELTKETLKENF